MLFDMISTCSGYIPLWSLHIEKATWIPPPHRVDWISTWLCNAILAAESGDWYLVINQINSNTEKYSSEHWYKSIVFKIVWCLVNLASVLSNETPGAQSVAVNCSNC